MAQMSPAPSTPATPSLISLVTAEAVLARNADNLTSGTVAAARVGDLSATYGRVLNPTATKTTAYTAAVQELVLTDATSGAFAVTLPTAPADGAVIEVKKIDASTNAVTITCGGSDTFTVGGTTLALAVQGHAAAVRYQTSTAKWTTISNDLPLSQVEARYRSVTQDAWWFGANDMTSQAGSPALSNSPGGFKYSSWLMHDAASDAIVGSLYLPPWVATVWIDVFWTNSSAATGAVRLRGTVQTVTAGQTLSTTDVLALSTATAAAQDILTVTRLGTQPYAVSGLANINLTRLGSDAADTLAGNMAILGVQLTVATTVPFP
jgi:Cu/Ag efflux protein CusF